MANRPLLSVFLLFISLYLVEFSSVSADTPCHCLFDQYLGTWTYYLSDNSYDNSVSCKPNFPVKQTLKLKLTSPNVVVDEDGNVGNFTLIYDEGVEIHLNSQRFFAFSNWKQVGSQVTSLCNETLPGWFHNNDGTQWGCFYGVQSASAPKTSLATQKHSKPKPSINLEQTYKSEQALVDELNNNQKLWKAKVYPEFVGKTIGELRALTGNTPSSTLRSFKPSENSNEHLNLKLRRKKASSRLPKSFDWRNVNGQNFVSPVRNQGACGSCYTFASTGMLEARIRVLSKNALTPTLSTQHIVSCSEYSQGCDGGFNYLVSKFGQDFGIYEESCYPYEGATGVCKAVKNCTDQQKWRATNYYYVGGYFGACDDQSMQAELYDNGPMAISFEVYNDFFGYSSGIYFHNETTVRKLSVNPWQETNHAVLLVGWGEEGGVPYWIVKNSWGPSWGEQGFFRILRGVDECAIESMAVAATPVLKGH